MSRTHRNHPSRMPDKKRVLRAIAGVKPQKQKRANERASLRKEYR